MAHETKGDHALRYMPQLDGLRCFAAVTVVLHHTLGSRLPRFGRTGFGSYGVWLFFVLSGFLITGILLRDGPRQGEPIGPTLRAFFARRFLRILPAYYLVLAAGIGFAIGPSFRADWAWHLSYLSNWRMAWQGRFAGSAAALWSLGVEEQFYLIWPAVVLLTPRRQLPRLFIGVAIAGVASRALIIAAHLNHGAPATVQTPTTSNLDPLAIGALLAWAHWSRVPRATIERATRWALCVGLALLVFVGLSSAHVIDRAWSAVQVVETLAAALISVYLVDRAAVGFARGSLAAAVLELPAVRYLGSISYGIYLWHHPLHNVMRQHIPRAAQAFVATPLGGLVYFATVLTVTIAVASLSWFLFEQPINALKQRFPYPRGAGAARGAPSWEPLATG